MSTVKFKLEDALTPSPSCLHFIFVSTQGLVVPQSLVPGNATETRKQYVQSLSRVMEAGGFSLLITSCNGLRSSC